MRLAQMLSPEALAELGGVTRAFDKGVCQLMCWYRDQMAVRLRAMRGREERIQPPSPEDRVRTQATLAAIQACLGEYHIADDDVMSVPLRKMLPLDRELLVWLVAWYEGDWGDGSDLAKRAGLTRWSLDRRCRRTEAILRGRFLSAGLI
jgi:hypothetical protein